MIIKKERYGKTYDYDDNTNKFLNPLTKKWVKNIRQQSKGKFIKKVKNEIKIQHRYYSFNLDFIPSTDNHNERINFFLYKVLAKYNFIKNRTNSIEDMDMDNDDKKPYFSIEQLEMILSKNWRTHLERLVRYGYIVHKKQRKETFILDGNLKYLKKDVNFNYFVPTDKLLITKKKYEYIKIWNVYNSVCRYYRTLELALGDYLPTYKKIYNSKFIITRKQFNRIIERKYKEYIIKKDNPSTLQEYKNNNKYLYKMMMDFNEGTKYTNLDFFKVDNFSGRVHSIFTYLSSDFMKYNTKVNYELDLHQSQMTILASILQDEIGDNSFTNDINNGVDIYIKIQKLLKLETRGIAKDFMFSMIFGSTGRKHKLFKKIYPDVEEYIYKVKTTYNKETFNFYKLKGKQYKPYAAFVMKLQKKETELFKKIWTLVNLHKHKIPMATRHDSIVIPIEYKEIGLDIMNNVLEQELNCKYKIK